VNKENLLGSQGKMAIAYSKLMHEMWYSNEKSIRPVMFKKILSEFYTQFQGFGQHDSQECISAILDLLGEDLFRRKGKKPYVEFSDNHGET